MAGAGMGQRAQRGGSEVTEISQARSWGTLGSPAWSLGFFHKCSGEIQEG